LLVTLVTLVDRLPTLPAPTRGRGRPNVYPDRLLLTALIIGLVRQLHTVPALLMVLAEPTADMQTLRMLLRAGERCPTRRTWQRRRQALPSTLPAPSG
jgi:hypothetical protein